MPPDQILFASWYTGLGGGETDLLSLAADLDKTRYLPHLLQPRDGQLAAKWRAAGWPVHLLPYRGATTLFIPALWARLPVVARFAQLIRQQGIALVHSDYHTLPMIAPAARRANVPIMWTVHGWWFHPKWWQRAFLRGMDAAVARSFIIRAGFLGDPPFLPPDDVPVIYSGVDTTRFHPDVDGLRLRFEQHIAQDAPVVAMIARFQSVKGHHSFQQMARQVARQIPEAHFIVAGDAVFGVASEAAYKREILQRAQDDPLLCKRLHYIGFRDDVEQVIGAADVLVCASEFESYGKANIEAMACATAVVSTNKGGPAETVLHSKTGYLVPPQDVDGLATAVIQLLQDAALRQQMGQHGRQRVLDVFSSSATAEKYTAIFERLLNKS